VVFVDFIEAFRQPLVTRFVAELALVIKDRLCRRLPDFIAHSLARKLAGGFFEITPEFLITFFTACESDNGHGGRQVAIGREVIQRRDEFAMREIAGGAENHNRARLRHCASGNSFAKWVQFLLVCCSVHNRNKLLVSLNADRQKIRRRELFRSVQ
jgi:hypothetical protein